MRTERSTQRRSYGTGQLFTKGGKWYGRWYVGDQRVKRAIGPVRKPGTRDGLTRTQAEARMRRLREETQFAPPAQAMTLKDAGNSYIEHLRLIGRKETTIEDYKIILRRHLVAAFGDRPLDRIRPDDVSRLMHRKLKAGLAHSTINHQLNLFQGIFRFGMQHGWATANPVASVQRPRSAPTDPDVRYLNRDELAALLEAAADDLLGPTDRAIWLTAAMTGLRQGELCALRWRDVDWVAGVIRVRRNYTRKQWGSPKSRRSSRAVPMTDRVAGELERHFQRSDYQHDDDLVFCHPQTGKPYDASKMRKRFKSALKRAKVREIRFHDLRHTFGTAMASAGAPLRAVQEWLGHCDSRTTDIYADYAPDASQAAVWAARAFEGPISGPKSSETDSNSDDTKPLEEAEPEVTDLA